MIFRVPRGQAEQPIPTGNSLATPCPYGSELRGSMAQALPNPQSAGSGPQLLLFLISTACSGRGSVAADPYATVLCAGQLGSRKPTTK